MAAQKRKAKLPQISPGANPYINPSKKVVAGLPVMQDATDFFEGLIGNLSAPDVAPALAPVAGPSRVPTARPFKRAQIKVARAVPARLDADSSDGVSHASFSDPFEVKDAPSSDGGQQDHDMGGMDPLDMDHDMHDFDHDAPAPKPEPVSDDDEILVKAPSTAKPKAPRQLVNGSIVVPKASLSSPVKPSPLSMELEFPTAEPLPPSKPKGMDWRTATSALAAAPLAFASTAEVEEEDVDVLPTPDSLKLRGKKVAVAPIVVENVGALEADGSLRFWWFDYVELSGGLLVLIGKVKAKGGKDDGKWVSATVTVEGIKRRLQILPRAKQLDGAPAFHWPPFQPDTDLCFSSSVISRRRGARRRGPARIRRRRGRLRGRRREVRQIGRASCRERVS